MKKLNPATGKPYKHGDKREDGMIFNSYSSSLDSKGFNYLQWLSPDAFKKAKTRSRGSYKDTYLRGKKYVDEYKIKKGCACCGYNKHASALDFDHLDPSTKSMAVSQMLALSFKRLKNEINKCQVLCANCHRIKTADPKHFKKLCNE
jgi:hypothetical protein